MAGHKRNGIEKDEDRGLKMEDVEIKNIEQRTSNIERRMCAINDEHYNPNP
jgi:hypothetical protein